jgi:hypothetical protein
MFVEFNAAAGTCEIGCWLEPSAEGHGLITAACRMLLTYAFEERNLHRAEWRCRADNVRSPAVAERLEMTLEGVLREAWLSGGVFHDTQVGALLPDYQSPDLSDPLAFGLAGLIGRVQTFLNYFEHVIDRWPDLRLRIGLFLSHFVSVSSAQPPDPSSVFMTPSTFGLSDTFGDLGFCGTGSLSAGLTSSED